MWALPDPVESTSMENALAVSLGFDSEIVFAGSRPEIGTPSCADIAIVCGESAPSRFGCETFGGAGVVGRSAGGVYPVSTAWPQRYGSDCTLPNVDQAIRVLWSMWRSVVVPAADVSSSSYGVMFSPMFAGSIAAGRSAIGILTSRL